MGRGEDHAPVRWEKSFPPPSEYWPVAHFSQPETGVGPEKLRVCMCVVAVSLHHPYIYIEA